jgi:uncharacterized OsmC-like protein
VLRRIHVVYDLQVDDDADRDAIERCHGFHQERCPVARSIGGSVDITTDIRIRGTDDG